MTKSRLGVLAAVGMAAIMVVLLQLRSRRGRVRKRQPGDREQRWLAVTINRPPDDLRFADGRPEPLERFRDGIEVRVEPAAGDKGTELRARPAEDGDVSRDELRLALRQAKSLVETGVVLTPDTRSTHPGPAGRLLRRVIGKSRREGRL